MSKIPTRALLVVDVQNDFCLAQPGFAYYDRQAMEKRDDLSPIVDTFDKGISPLIEQSRKLGLQVIFVKSAYGEGQFADMSRLCIPGTEGSDFYMVKPLNHEKVFEKHGHNPFESNQELGQHLNKNGSSTILVAGFTTDNCISRTAYGALYFSITPIVLGDCVSTAGYKREDWHIKKLREFEEHRFIGLLNSSNLEFHP